MDSNWESTRDALVDNYCMISCYLGSLEAPGKGEFSLDLSRHSNAKVLLEPTFAQKLNDLTDLSLDNACEECFGILKSAPVKNLKKLKIRFDREVDQLKCLQILGESTILSNLSDLNLEMGQFGAKGLEVFKGNKTFNNLRHLDLSHVAVKAEGIKVLSECEFFKNLHCLVLSDAQIDAEALNVLKGVEFKNLEVLKIDRCGDMGMGLKDGISALKDCTHLKGLKELDIHQNGLGHDGVVAFLGSCSLSSLTKLSLGNNQLTADTVALLKNCTWLTNLKDLDLSTNPIGDNGLAHLKDCGFAKNLTKLDACMCKLTDASVDFLKANFTHLEGVNLICNEITEDKKVQFLTKGNIDF